MAKKTEYEEKKEIADLQEKYGIEQHKRRMIELAYIRETNKINHNDDLMRGRIKSAEIKRAFERRELARKFRYET